MTEECCILGEKTGSVLSRSMLVVRMAEMNGLVVLQSVPLAQTGTAKSNLGIILLCAN